MFTDKTKYTQNIILIDNDSIVSDNKNIAEIFNNFFINVVANLGITINNEIIANVDNILDPVLNSIKKYEKHPSIVKINKLSKQKKLSAFSMLLKRSTNYCKMS